MTGAPDFAALLAGTACIFGAGFVAGMLVTFRLLNTRFIRKG